MVALDLMRKSNGKLPFTMDGILTNVRDGTPQGAYGWAVTHFLPCVVGNIPWRAAITTTRLSKLANITDEVLMLFLLENNWKVWEATYHNKSVNNDDEKVEVPRALYTEFSGKTARKYSGWNVAGMHRWNAFWNMIRLKRKKDEETLKDYKKMVDKGSIDPYVQGQPSTFDSRYMEYAAEIWGGKEPHEERTGSGTENVTGEVAGPKIMHGYHDDEDYDNWLKKTHEQESANTQDEEETNVRHRTQV